MLKSLVGVWEQGREIHTHLRKHKKQKHMHLTYESAGNHGILINLQVKLIVSAVA
jgi:hypothetical protein